MAGNEESPTLEESKNRLEMELDLIQNIQADLLVFDSDHQVAELSLENMNEVLTTDMKKGRFAWPRNFTLACSEERTFWPHKGSEGMLPTKKKLKMKYLRLAVICISMNTNYT